ncbi:hypothetical protein QUB30_18190 [Microcoleus sp. BROC3]
MWDFMRSPSSPSQGGEEEPQNLEISLRAIGNNKIDYRSQYS